jgi:hypothetical protein
LSNHMSLVSQLQKPAITMLLYQCISFTLFPELLHGSFF